MILSPAEIRKFNTAAFFFLALMFRVHVKYHIFDDARASFAQYQSKSYSLES